MAVMLSGGRINDDDCIRGLGRFTAEVQGGWGLAARKVHKEAVQYFTRQGG